MNIEVKAMLVLNNESPRVEQASEMVGVRLKDHQLSSVHAMLQREIDGAASEHGPSDQPYYYMPMNDIYNMSILADQPGSVLSGRRQ